MNLFQFQQKEDKSLNRIKPVNIGQAGRISGVSPSDVNILLMYLGR